MIPPAVFTSAAAAFTITLFFVHSIINAQAKNARLAAINTVAQAEDFITLNPKLEGKLFEIESKTDTAEILLPLYGKRAGYTFRIDDLSYKIISIDSFLAFRVSYIYLSGEEYSKHEADSLRGEIILKYLNGTSFPELAIQYNMDGNITGDTKWFPEKMMVRDFEAAVKQHKKNDIFTVDTPAQNWYHVVLKTYDDTIIKKLKIIKIKSGN